MVILPPSVLKVVLPSLTTSSSAPVLLKSKLRVAALEAPPTVRTLPVAEPAPFKVNVSSISESADCKESSEPPLKVKVAPAAPILIFALPVSAPVIVAPLATEIAVLEREEPTLSVKVPEVTVVAPV